MTQQDEMGQLVIAVSARTLFDFAECNEIYEKHGLEAYEAFQMRHEKQPLKKGPGFALIEKCLSLNHEKLLVEVILVSRNSANTGLRVFNSIEHYGLAIKRAAFTNGAPPYSYIKALGAHLFLSVNSQDVEAALAAGCAAATLMGKSTQAQHQPKELRFAFDGDAVLFSDETERLLREKGLQAVRDSEQKHADIPLPQGPFYRFLTALAELQQLNKTCIRTALVTARSAPSHKRVINTLRAWGVTIDESFFLGGMSKASILSSFKADIFFDDTLNNCVQSHEFVTTGHVPYGVANESKKGEHH